MPEALIGLPQTMRTYVSASASGATRGRQQATDVIAALVVVGLISAWIAAVSSIENSFTTVNSDGKFVMQLVKTPLYYGAHGLSICCVTTAGLLSALDGRWRVIDLGARVAFYILLLEAVLWTGFGYTTDEILSSKILGATGPFVWITLLVVIAGTDRSLWRYIDPTIRMLAYASSALAIRTLITLNFASYLGASKFTEYTILLMWLGGWTLLSASRIKGWQLFARALPVACLIPMALCSQSRSLTLDSCLLVILFVVLRAREKGSIARAVPILVTMCVLGCGVALLVYSIVPQTVNASINGLNTRLEEDTRSGQYTAFFEVVPVSDLLLGRGPNGTWYWRGFGEYQFFDNGYLWMLFIGGVPTLICYMRIVVWPAMRATRKRPRGEDAAAVCLVLLWGVCLSGLSVFTLPSVEITNFAILLFVGRCHLLLAERPEWIRTGMISTLSPSRLMR